MESSYYLPINGMDSLVSGIFSAMANMKTEKARITVTPRAIFSPESGGHAEHQHRQRGHHHAGEHDVVHVVQGLTPYSEAGKLEISTQ